MDVQPTSNPWVVLCLGQVPSPNQADFGNSSIPKSVCTYTCHGWWLARATGILTSWGKSFRWKDVLDGLEDLVPVSTVSVWAKAAKGKVSWCREARTDSFFWGQEQSSPYISLGRMTRFWSLFSVATEWSECGVFVHMWMYCNDFHSRFRCI